MILLPPHHWEVGLIENLGILGVACLMHPKALSEFLPLAESRGVVPLEEAFSDVYRVTYAYTELPEVGWGIKNRALVDYFCQARAFREMKWNMADEKAIGFLRKFARGFRNLPTAEHGRNASKLLASHPEWITSQMRESNPIIQEVFRFRDVQLGREMERDARLARVLDLPPAIAVTAGVALIVGSELDSWFLIGGTAMIVAGAFALAYGDFARGRETDNKALWDQLHDGTPYPGEGIPGVHTALT